MKLYVGGGDDQYVCVTDTWKDKWGAGSGGTSRGNVCAQRDKCMCRQMCVEAGACWVCVFR